LEESLNEACLNFFKSQHKLINFRRPEVVLKKYITRKLSPSKAERIKKQLKDIDVIFYIKIRPSSIKIELYNTQYEVLAKYNNQNLKNEFNQNIFYQNIFNFYERYFFTSSYIQKDEILSSNDSVVINGKRIGSVQEFEIENSTLKISNIPKNIKSYIQIESNEKNLISDKYYLQPEVFSLRRLNKKNIQNKRIKEKNKNIQLSFREKIGAFKINLINQNKENINSLTPEVKLYDLLNPKGISTQLINNENDILILTNEKFQKNWTFRASVLQEGFPKTPSKKITLVDSSSYQLNTVKPIKFMLTKYSQPKAYTYNLVLPGLGQILAGDEGKAWRAYTPMSTYLLFGLFALKNILDFNDNNDNSKKYLNLYNSGPAGQQGNVINKNLSLEYYNKAATSEKNIYMYTGALLVVNALANYYIRSDWFQWK